METGTVNTNYKLNNLRMPVTVLVFAMLSFFSLWFFMQPFRAWERKSLKLSAYSPTAPVGKEEIYQTLNAPSGIRGISVSLSNNRSQVSGTLLFTLYDASDEAVDHAALLLNGIRAYAYVDVVFNESHEPGDYKIGVVSGPDVEGKVSIYETKEDSYKYGESIDKDLERKYADWAFMLLVPYSAGVVIRHHIINTAGLIIAAFLLMTGLLCAIDRRALAGNRKLAGIKDLVLKYQKPVFILTLILIPTILYMDFLAGDRYYVFNVLDKGYDSGAQTYPTLLELARRLIFGTKGSYFNFRQGLGSSEPAFFPTLTNWVAFFGEKAVAYLLGISQWLKVIGCGIFAYLFALEFGTGQVLAFVAAAGFEFNSMLIARGAWQSYPNLALLVILWMYVYELSRKKRRYLLFSLVTVVLFSGVVVFDCVFYCAMLGGYLLLRNLLLDVEEEPGRLKRVFRELVVFLVFWLFGSADTLRGSFMQAVGSSRFSEGVAQYSGLGADGFWSGTKVWMTAFLRTVGHSICGLTEGVASHNILEGPAFYCGILAFLLLPTAVLVVKGKKRIGYLICIAAAVFFIACVPFRLVASGFAKDTFKLSSFWITLVMFLLELELFAAVRAGLKPGRKAAALMFSSTVICLLLYQANKNGYVVDREAFICSAFMVVFYAFLLLTSRLTGHHIAMFLLCAGVCIEMLTVSSNIIDDRFNYSEMEMTVSCYNDETAGVIERLKEEDAGWYRIEKHEDSEYLSDSLAQDYYGTKSYVGGTEITRGVLDLYNAYDLPSEGNHFLKGSGTNIYFESVAGVKYYLTKNSYTSAYGFSYLSSDGTINVFENELALPLFYVTEDDSVPQTDEQLFLEKGEPVLYTPDGIGFIFDEILNDRVVLLDMKFSEEGTGCLYLRNTFGEVNEFLFNRRKNVKIEFIADDIETIWLSNAAFNNLKDLTVYSMDSMLYYLDFEERVHREQASVTGFSKEGENHFTGSVKAEENSFLATVIPYDPDWKISIDGNDCETVPVRGGFLGTRINAGEHEIEIVYQAESWLGGNLMRILGFVLLAVWLIAGRYVKIGRTGEAEK